MSLSLLPIVLFLTSVIVFSEAWVFISSHLLSAIGVVIVLSFLLVPTYRLAYVQVQKRRIDTPPLH